MDNFGSGGGGFALTPDGDPENRPPARTGQAITLRDAALAELALPTAPTAGERRFDVMDAWRIILKWRWLILGTIAACTIGALLISFLITPIYRASVLLELNKEQPQVVDIGKLQATQVNDSQFLDTQVGLLKSRSLADRVAKTLNLASNPEFGGAAPTSRQRQEAAAARLSGGFDVVPGRNSRLLTLNYDGENPALAASIANSYAESFIASNLERRFEATSYARTFLDRRIQIVKKNLEDSERKLVAYAQAQGIVIVEGGGDSAGGKGSESTLDAGSAIALNDALAQARAARIAAEGRYRSANSTGTSTQINDNAAVAGLAQERAKLTAEYQEKLATLKPDFPTMVSLRSRMAAIEAAINRERGGAINAVRSDYLAKVTEERQLEAKVNQAKGSMLDLRRRSIDYTILQREVDTNRALYDALLQRFKEVGIAGGVGSNLVTIVDRAEVPKGPIRPNVPLNLLFGLGLGTILGFGAAFGIEFVDDTIRVPDDLKEKLGLTPLGVVPKLAPGVKFSEAIDDQKSEISEAYNSLRSALQFSSAEGAPRSLLITSSRPGEGKSSTSFALAQKFARLGVRVLLVDADMRKPTFAAPKGSGLSVLLTGKGALAQSVLATRVDGLSLLPSGPVPPNPADLLASPRIRELLADAMAAFDMVIIDGPPILGLSDALELAAVCEGTLMVFETAEVRRAVARNALGRLRGANAALLGGIITKFDPRRTGNGYGYGYGYGESPYGYGHRDGEDADERRIKLLDRS